MVRSSVTELVLVTTKTASQFPPAHTVCASGASTSTAGATQVTDAVSASETPVACPLLMHAEANSPAVVAMLSGMPTQPSDITRNEPETDSPTCRVRPLQVTRLGTRWAHPDRRPDRRCRTPGPRGWCRPR